MAYNLHPIFVHFPVALLFLYSLVKIVPIKKWLPSVSWGSIERFLLFFGVLGAFAALSTGELAEEFVKANHKLVETHAFFGTFSTWVYGALLIGELAAYVNKMYAARLQSMERIGAFSRFLERILCNRSFAIFLSFVGLVAISITGMLGGVIAYGLTADPFAPFLLKILGIELI